MEQDQAIAKLKEYFKEKGFLLAYLFGSRALDEIRTSSNSYQRMDKRKD